MSRRFFGFERSASWIGFLDLPIAVQTCDMRCLNSRNNFDGITDRKTELVVRALLIDGDFGKSVGILIPESHARLSITERPRGLQNPSRNYKFCNTRELGDPQASHCIAKVINVDAATGAKRSRPWKLADRRSGFQSMSQL